MIEKSCSAPQLSEMHAGVARVAGEACKWACADTSLIKEEAMAFTNKLFHHHVASCVRSAEFHTFLCQKRMQTCFKHPACLGSLRQTSESDLNERVSLETWHKDTA